MVEDRSITVEIKRKTLEHTKTLAFLRFINTIIIYFEKCTIRLTRYNYYFSLIKLNINYKNKTPTYL